MATRNPKYLTTDEIEALFDEIITEALIKPLEEFYGDHPEIPIDDPRHKEALQRSLAGMRIIFMILRRFDLVPKIGTVRPKPSVKLAEKMEKTNEVSN